jgi:DNA-binding XRE family transcriptional regulator
MIRIARTLGVKVEDIFLISMSNITDNKTGMREVVSNA